MTPFVTRHAIRRYAERVLAIELDDELSDDDAVAVLVDRGVDVVEIAEAIRVVCQQAVDLGACGVKALNVRFALRGRVVVSVLPKRRPDLPNQQHHIGRQ
jgi:hypothetical protein